MILRFDPFQAGFLAFLIFYVCTFLALSGSIFSVSELVLAKIFKRSTTVFLIQSDIRHAIQFTVLVVTWAILKSNGLLRWWNLLLLILILTVIEFLSISLEREKRSCSYERENPTTQPTISTGNPIDF